MKGVHRTVRVFSLLWGLILIMGSCEREFAPLGYGPPPISPESLLSAPDTLLFEGRKFFLRTSLWRDFMPIVPPEGPRFYGVITLEATDTSSIPPSLRMTDFYLIHKRKVWWALFSEEPPADEEVRPNRLVKIVRGNLSWEQGIRRADVVVGLTDRRQRLLIKAQDQPIEETW